MIEDEGGCSRAQAGLDPAVVGWEGPEEVSAEPENDVDGCAGVFGTASDGEGGCMSRGKQGSGSKKRGKHGGQGCMWILWDFVRRWRRGKERKGGHWV